MATPELETEREHASPAAGALLWITLVVSSFAVSAHFNAAAPCGRWLNTVFDAELWYENDPSGSYIASAHELFSAPSPLFPGHPGTPLQLGLYGVQAAYFAAAAPETMAFTEFTARRIDRVHELSKLFATGLHVASFFAVYAFAVRLLASRRAARLATIAYATSFPVLYYLSRVSVEPLIVLFFCATLLAIWRALGAAERGVRNAALGWSVAAAVLAVSGLVSKLHFLGPLPAFALLYLIVAMRKSDGLRVRCALAFVVASAATLAAYAPVLDWRELIELWTQVGKVRESAQRSTTFLPAATPGGLFLLCESVLVVLGTIGWVRALRSPERRAKTIWVSAYGAWALAIWGYRVVARGGDFRSFHYLFLEVLLLAVFAGGLANDVLSRWNGAARVAAATVWLALLHGVSFAALVDTRTHDADEFSRIAPVHALVHTLAAGERIALTTPVGFGKFRRVLIGLDKGGSNIHGLSARYAPDGRTSRLAAAYAELFVRMKPREVPADARIGVLDEFGAYAVISR